MSRQSYFALAVGVVLVVACDRPGQRPSTVTMDADTYAVKEAALAHVIREFAPSGECRLIITDSEYSKRLVAALSQSTAADCCGPEQWRVENGAYFDAETGQPVVLLGAEIVAIGRRHATVEVELDAGFDGGTWYTVQLRKDGVDWIVEFAELVAHS